VKRSESERTAASVLSSIDVLLNALPRAVLNVVDNDAPATDGIAAFGNAAVQAWIEASRSA